MENVRVPDFSVRFSSGMKLFPACHVGADIGSDHGKMAVALLQSGLCRRTIATDISAPSLSKARKAAKTHALEEKMEFRVGDGLSIFEKGEADVAIIAGMGGEMIAKILTEGEHVARAMNALLLQPMQHAAKLRYFLRNNGWRIEEECICNEGRRIYEWMRVVSGAPDHYPGEFSGEEEGPNVMDEIGPLLFLQRDPLSIERLRFKRKTWQREYELARRGITDSAGQAATNLRNRVLQAESLLSILEGRQ